MGKQGVIESVRRRERPNHVVSKPKRQLSPLIRAARREGVPVLGAGQVYVIKHGTDYHAEWCQVVADTWDQTPRRLLVTFLAAVGERTRCAECGQPAKAAKATATQEPQQPRPTPESPPPDTVVPLKVVGLAQGIVFLAAAQEYRQRLSETAVEPATPLYVDGRREGQVVRLDSARQEPLVLVQLDPRTTFRNGPYQVRLRHPLRRTAAKPYAVESVESVPAAQ